MAKRAWAWLGMVWIALVSVNYAVAVAGREPARPRFDGILDELAAAGSWSPGVALRTLGSVAVIGLAVAGMLGAGLPWLRFALRRTGAGRRRLPWAMALGFSVFGIAFLGLAMTGLVRPAVLWLVLPGCVMAAARRIVGMRFRKAKRRGVGGAGPVWAVPAAAAGVLAVVSASLGPETEIDSLMYHLARAKHLLLEGRMTVEPSMMFAFPPVWECWLAFLLAAGGEQAARLLNPVVLAATAWLLSGVVNRVRPGAGPVAAVFYAVSFVAAASGSSSKSDAAVAWLAVAVLAAAWRGTATRGGGWAALAGWFAGAALLVKLTAAPAVLVSWVVLARGGRPRSILAAAVATGVGLPWLAHNIMVWANPVQPVLRDLSAFPPPAGAGLNYADELRACLDGTYDTLVARVRAVWSLATAETATALALLAAPLAVPVLRPAAAWWALPSVALVVLWAAGPPQPRYLLPAVPWFAASLAVWAYGAKTGPGRRRSWLVLALLALESGRVWLDPHADRSARLGVAIGTIPASTYLRCRLTTYADAMLRIDASIPSSSRLLLVGERRYYPLHARFRAVRSDDPTPFLRFAADARDTGHLGSKLRQWGVTRVLYNPLTADFLGAEFARVRPADRSLAVWAAYWRDHAHAVAWPARADLREGEFFLFELRREGPRRIAPWLPGIEGWTAGVSELAVAGDRAGALRRLDEVAGLAGDWPVLGLWRVMVSGTSMPAAEALGRLERVERAGLAASHVQLGLVRAARRAGRRDLVARHEARFRALVPETWLRQP